MRVDAEPDLDTIRFVCRNLREVSRREMFLSLWSDEPDVLAEAIHQTNQFAWAFWCDGEPAAVVGAYPMHPGVWGLFGFGTDKYAKIMLSVTKHARRFMMPALLNAGAHRAQCIAPADHYEQHKWLRFLGAEEESTMRGYGKNREDVKMFAWHDGR